MIRRFYYNPLLSGRPGRGFKHTVKHYESGNRISIPKPVGPQFLNYPHLAHLDPVEQDGLIALLISKHAKQGRKKRDGVDSLFQVPRKRTCFPAQHARCWYCGRQYIRGGNGIREHLACSGSREWHCWNSIAFNGALAATRLVEVVTNELFRLTDFDVQYAELIQIAMENRLSGSSDRWAALTRDEAKLSRDRENVKSTIAAYGPGPLTRQMFDELAQTEQRIAHDRWQLESVSARQLVVPSSTAELRGLLEEQFTRLAIESPEFGDLMRLLVPDFQVYLVRLCDGGTYCHALASNLT